VTSPDIRQKFREYLVLERGLKWTRQRSLILEAFLDSGSDLSVDEFYRQLRSKHKNIGCSTVYRTLKLLAESGIARDIRTDYQPIRYECITDEQ
jgi:Fur family ferric uptake transcriptional regulator